MPFRGLWSSLVVLYSCCLSRAIFEDCVEVEEGREMSLANDAGAGYGEVPLLSMFIDGVVLLYFSRSGWAEAVRRIGSMGGAR